MGKSQREKGKRGEREFARLCRDNGYEAHRAQQYCGKAGDSDVKGLPHMFVEVKRVERLNVSEAMAKAKSESNGQIPMVAHRKDNHEWLITMTADDWFKLYREWETDTTLKGG